MTKIDWTKVDDFDLLFYSTPCQSISAAGLQHGFAEGSGTRSSIIWNVRDAVKIKRPKYLVLENVKAMVSKKFVPMFNLWQSELERLGYANFAQILNAKDFGVPQNRERIFLVSIRMDELEGLAGNVRYHFPKPFPLKLRLKDVLEDEVDERYYLSDERVQSLFNNETDTSEPDA
jgi:DNA (cytosine-5)-methyltransferase 1